MAVVTIRQAPSDLEAKRRLVAAITEAFVDVYATPLDQVLILFEEFDREHWAKGGVLGVDTA
jgi:4-oxalocrotonate tautomerase